MRIKSEKLWMNRKIKKEMGKYCEPHSNHYVSFASPKNQRENSGPHHDHKQRVRPVVEKDLLFRGFDASVCQDHPNDVGYKSADKQCPRWSLGNATLDSQARSKMCGVHQADSRSPKTLIKDRRRIGI